MILFACTGSHDLVSHEALGITFKCSDRLALGAYQVPDIDPETRRTLEKAGVDTSGANCVALIEPREIGQQHANAIRMGGVPSISIKRYAGQHADFFRHSLFKDEFKVHLGTNTAYRLPGAPGPFGDEAFYYLVPLRSNIVYELSAHKYYMREGSRQETHYDRDIETIITGMEPMTSQND